MARTGRPREFDMDAALDAALCLFWEHGYESTSLAMLREAMGISSASFYAAFSSKEQLFAAIVGRYLTSFGRVTAAIADSALAPRTAVEQILRQSIAMQTDMSHPTGCLIVLGGPTCPPGNDPVSDLLTQQREVVRQNLAACIGRAVASGDLPASTEPAALASMYSAFLWGLSIEARDGLTAPALDAAVGQIMRVWDGLAENRSSPATPVPHPPAPGGQLPRPAGDADGAVPGFTRRRR